MEHNNEFGQRVWEYIRSTPELWKETQVAQEGYYTGAWSQDEKNAREMRIRAMAAEQLIAADAENLSGVGSNAEVVSESI
jgi:hypothetical protein